MATIDLDDDMWVIPVLDRIHERMLATGDFEGMRRLGRMDDVELIRLAHAEIDTWRATT